MPARQALRRYTGCRRRRPGPRVGTGFGDTYSSLVPPTTRSTSGEPSLCAERACSSRLRARRRPQASNQGKGSYVTTGAAATVAAWRENGGLTCSNLQSSHVRFALVAGATAPCPAVFPSGFVEIGINPRALPRNELLGTIVTRPRQDLTVFGVVYRDLCDGGTPRQCRRQWRPPGASGLGLRVAASQICCYIDLAREHRSAGLIAGPCALQTRRSGGGSWPALSGLLCLGG